MLYQVVVCFLGGLVYCVSKCCLDDGSSCLIYVVSMSEKFRLKRFSDVSSESDYRRTIEEVLVSLVSCTARKWHA